MEVMAKVRPGIRRYWLCDKSNQGGPGPCDTLRVSAISGKELNSGPTAGNFPPCPHCGKRGRRVRVITRWVRHPGLHQKTWIWGRVGVYKARCKCGKYFQAPLPGVPSGGRYSLEVRNEVANALIRDRLPCRKVKGRMMEDFGLDLSLGFIHDCFIWAHRQISDVERRRWAAAHFSGVICIDEVHDGGRVVLYATDPLADFTIHFAVNESNDQEHMDAFLAELREMGIIPVVAITDGSSLYQSALREVWAGIAHQLCLFHVIKEVNKIILDALRSVKNSLRRQGHKGRRRKPGRPSRNAQQQRRAREGRSREEQATFLWENQHLIVRKQESLTEEDRQNLQEMCRMAPEIRLLRRFNQDFYRLFERGLTQRQARRRRSRMANNHNYQNHPFLAQALKKLRRDRFEKMIVFMAFGKNAQRTSNHVERNNRSFRMLQKTRYKRRLITTIRMAIELDLYARMLDHPLFDPGGSIPLALLQNGVSHAA